MTHQRRNDGIDLYVRDNGIGIAPAFREQVYPGTGIGRAICRKIVDRMGGGSNPPAIVAG